MKTWNGIREVINIRTKEIIFNYVSDQFNNTTITDSKLIANLFNNHFTSIAKNMKQKKNNFEIQILRLFEKSLSEDLPLNTFK